MNYSHPSKRLRLDTDSWGDPPLSPVRPPSRILRSQQLYTNSISPVMDAWDSNPPIPQPGQHTISNSRSQPSVRPPSGTPPGLYTHRSGSQDTPPALENQQYSIYSPLSGPPDLGRKPSSVEPGYFGGFAHPPTTQAEMSTSPTGQLPPGSTGPPSSGTTYPPRRKAIRAAQACDACRARKAKCDEGRPQCGFCRESGVNCVYREVPPPK